jgi:epoxyqueuosine reductase
MSEPDSAAVKDFARACGFHLVGITTADPPAEAAFYAHWLAQGCAGEMGYLYGRRAEMRADLRALLPSARSVISLGLLYNTPLPYSTKWNDRERAWISRYAWGEDYHKVMRKKMEALVTRFRGGARFESKICVDTAPVLERAYAQRAGLGWIGHNTCLINQQIGSWVFLGEILTSLDLEPDRPAPFRCGTCCRCIDACPTGAIVPAGRPDGPAYTLDARLCISYWTIELQGPIAEEHRSMAGAHVFGCDICQDVCPWNRRAPSSGDPAFLPRWAAPPLEKLASITEPEFEEMFRSSPIKRAGYSGFRRNVVVAMGNSGDAKFRQELERLAGLNDSAVREHALWALAKIGCRP